ncbi:MAG: hypothetical protein K5745_07070, partial [Saccharofermentans sp.]|nr:hypothetical protein [Saccharofermentans sp.]
ISATDKGTYYQDGWEITSLVDHQYIEIQARMNEDGTFDFKGQVEYYVYTEYSIIREYNEHEMMYGVIDITGVKKFPKNTEVDLFTDLTYKDNKFTIHYKYVDQYSVSFRYIYESKVVYKID